MMNRSFIQDILKVFISILIIGNIYIVFQRFMGDRPSEIRILEDEVMKVLVI